MMSREQGNTDSFRAIHDNVDRAESIAKHLIRSTIFATMVARRGERSVAEEAWEIGTALADICESTTRLFDELLPALLRAEPSSIEVEDLLHEIGEEYRHIHYHITNSRFFSHVVSEPEA